MKFFALILCCLIANVTELASASSNPTFGVNYKEHNFKKDDLVDALDLNGSYDAVRPKDMPSIVPMTAQQKLYVYLIVQAIFRVIVSKSPLASEEKIFGEGKFFLPKKSELANLRLQILPF